MEITGSEHQQQQQCCSSEFSSWCTQRPLLQQVTVKCAKQCQLAVTQPLAHQQRSSCCQGGISLGLCVYALPGPTLPAVAAEGKSLLLLCRLGFTLAGFSLLAICSSPGMHCAQAVPSECPCGLSPGLPCPTCYSLPFEKLRNQSFKVRDSSSFIALVLALL